MDELRRQAKTLGILATPPRRGSAEWFRYEMFELLSAEPEPVASKGVELPVQVATFEVI
jgi:hypothetical protein